MAKSKQPKQSTGNGKIMTWLIWGLLIFGVSYHILLTLGGNFIFHIDSARDMIDVREMVVLHHFRLIGPTAGIDGLFTGPGWYYLMAIPFVLSGGDPFSEVLLMDVFWFIGGYFLLKMLRPRGILAVITAGALWITSGYVVLVTLFAYSPNPVVLMAPLIIFLLAKYIDQGTMKSALFLGFLGAFFWNLEMAFAGFMPFIIVLAIILAKKWRYLLSKHFWLGVAGPFLLGLLPQFLFEIRHNFFMTRSLFVYVTEQKSSHSTFSLIDRTMKSYQTFLEGFRGTFFNQPGLIGVAILVMIFLLYVLIFRKKGHFDSQILVAILLLVVPFIGFCIFPLVIQLWHIEPALVGLIFLTAISLGEMEKITHFGKWLGVLVTAIILVFSLGHLELGKNFNLNRPTDDPSEYKNEIAAIDYAYNQAQGKNFKAYVYSPGILDLPYQYNFWWYGQKKYGYAPIDYAYLPNQPEYIKDKARLPNKLASGNSGLVILIKEPGYPAREDLWKNSFTSLPTLKTATIGPLSVEVKREK